MIFRYLPRFLSRKQWTGKYLPAMFLALVVTFWVAPPATATGPSCCIVRGNVDCDPDGIVDIADLSRLIDYMFISFAPLCCDSAGNIDGDPEGIIDIADLSRLIDYMFVSLEPLDTCGPGTLSYLQRDAVFDALDSARQSLAGKPADSVAIALAAFLDRRPEIDSAGISDSLSVWAYFIDGWVLVIPNNRFPSGGNSSSPILRADNFVNDVSKDFKIPARRFPNIEDPTGLGPQKSPADISISNFDLPSSIQARVVSTLHVPPFTIGAPIIKSMIEDHGYVTVPFDGSVSSLLNVQDDGIFYMDAHGATFPDGGPKGISVWTANVRSVANDRAFKSMLTKRELVIMSMYDYNPVTRKVEDHERYGFTGKFVAQYMSFAPNSYIFINSCVSDAVPSLRNGFFTAGASVFCGWTLNVNDGGANRAAEFLFDRMLGANSSTYTPKESPPQRPFDIDQLYTDMKNRGFDIDPQPPNARMKVERLQNHFGLLAPSIRNLAIVEHFDTLYVLGIFGTDPGPSKRRVYVGGTDMLVYNWQPEMITCFVPNTGAGSVGPVTVEVDGATGPSSSVKRVSNTVNLTEWKGQFTYSLKDAGTLLKTIVIDAHLRADIHKFRDVPHLPPTIYSIIFPAAEDSYGLATVSGTYSYTWPGSDPTSIDTWTWTGSTYLPGLWQGGLDFVMSGQVDAPTQIMKFRLAAAVTGGLKETITNNLGGSPTIYDLSVSIPWELYDAFPELFNLTLSNTWDIVGSQRVYDACCSVWPGNDGTVNDLHHKLQWPTITASFPPDSTQGQ